MRHIQYYGFDYKPVQGATDKIDSRLSPVQAMRLAANMAFDKGYHGAEIYEGKDSAKPIYGYCPAKEKK